MEPWLWVVALPPLPGCYQIRTFVPKVRGTMGARAGPRCRLVPRVKAVGHWLYIRWFDYQTLGWGEWGSFSRL